MKEKFEKQWQRKALIHLVITSASHSPLQLQNLKGGAVRPGGRSALLALTWEFETPTMTGAIHNVADYRPAASAKHISICCPSIGIGRCFGAQI